MNKVLITFMMACVCQAGHVIAQQNDDVFAQTITSNSRRTSQTSCQLS